MSKKKPSSAQAADTPAQAPVNPFAGTVGDSAAQIWLAGLGAFAKAQQEGGKVFDALVKEGTQLQQQAQTVAEDKLAQLNHLHHLTDQISGIASDASAKAGQQWDRLESIFEERTARALRKLGVPSAGDVEALNQRVDELRSQLAALTGATATKPADPAAPSRSRRSASSAAGKTAPASTPAKRSASKPSSR